MSLRPFHRGGNYRFFSASPESCTAHIVRERSSPGDDVLVINDWYLPDHPGGVEACRQLPAARFRRLRIPCDSGEEQATLHDDFGFPEAVALHGPRRRGCVVLRR